MCILGGLPMFCAEPPQSLGTDGTSPSQQIPCKSPPCSLQQPAWNSSWMKCWPKASRQPSTESPLTVSAVSKNRQFCGLHLPPERLCLPHLHTLPFFADQGRLHHAVVTPQLPDFVYQLHVVPTRRCNTVSSQRVLFGRLWGSFGVEDVKNNVALAHVKIPCDHRRGIHDLDENLRQERHIRQQQSAQ